MAALDRLFEDALTERKAGATDTRGRDPLAEAGALSSGSVATPPRSVSALPLLPLPDVPRPEQTPARHLMTSERDGEWQDEHESWMGQRDRDVALYGSVEDVRAGWTKEVA